MDYTADGAEHRASTTDTTASASSQKVEDLGNLKTNHTIEYNTADLPPRPNNNGPFAYTPAELMDLIDPKSVEKLEEYGGPTGLVAGLHTDPERGLSTSNQPLTAIVDGEVSEKTIGSTGISMEDRTEAFGRNVLPQKKPKSIFQLMWIALQEKIIILLLIAAVISIGLGFYEDYGVDHKPEPRCNASGECVTAEPPKISWVEGVAILAAVTIVIMVGSLNDYQKEKQFQKLNAKKEDREVKVIRNGESVLISVFDVSVGDIMHLEPGDMIAADGVYLRGHNLKCDESAMTGESDAIKKVTLDEYKQLEAIEAGHQQKALIQTTPEGVEVVKESHTLHGVDPFIISGSKVLEGVGIYVVTGVGPNSFHGKTMMSLRTEAESTPLQEKLNDLAEKIAKLGSAAAILMLITLLIRFFIGFRKEIPSGGEIADKIVGIIIAAVTVIVVAVPEGLPLAVTLALAFATTRMLRDNNLVRVLAACETMGNATTVCSDKTGTLTQNKMTIVAGTFGINSRFIADAPEGEANPRASLPINKHAIAISQLNSQVSPEIMTLVHETIAINSSAFESEDDKGVVSFIGSKTEVALLDFSKSLGGNYRAIRDAAPIVHLFPFSSERKAMATIVKMGPNKFRLHAKGASEIIMKRCRKILQVPFGETDSSKVTELELTEDIETQVHKTIISYATQSLRTIGIAYRDFESWPPAGVELNADGEVPFSAVAEDGLTLVGVVGIEDPLRDGVPEAVLSCQRAGVFVRMVTGDNILTAKSIATQCGIYTQGGIIMEGPKFRALSDDEMDAVIPRLQVLARSSPDDKKILVGRLKALGEIVAVTGDGTNDGPALKLSDVGFSMGIAGTEVAKEASDIILMDDNFSSIVKAILWGRAVNDAVKKFLQFQLTVNVTAVILTFVTAVASSDQKPVMSAVQLLWINLIMDTLAALALATDPPTMDLLDRQPEPRSAPLITFNMWKMILGESVLQLIITLVLEFAGMDIFNFYDVTLSPSDQLLPPDEADKILNARIRYNRQVLGTMIFNTYVCLQIFNEVNCRRLDNRLNIFAGITKNNYFMVIFVIMCVLQALIVQFGGAAFETVPINGLQWLVCILLGTLSIPIGVVIRLLPDAFFGPLKKFIEKPSKNAPVAPRFDNNYAPSFAGTPRVGSMNSSASNIYPNREALVWNSAITRVRSELSVFKAIRGGRVSGDSRLSDQHVLHAGAMVPSLVATSVGAGWAPRSGSTPGHSSSQVDVAAGSPRNSFAGSRQGTASSGRFPTPPPQQQQQQAYDQHASSQHASQPVDGVSLAATTQ